MRVVITHWDPVVGVPVYLGQAFSVDARLLTAAAADWNNLLQLQKQNEAERHAWIHR